MREILGAIGVFLFWGLPFLPVLCLFLLPKETKKLRFTLITVGALVALFVIEIIWAMNASDFHVAAFLVQLFMPAQLIFTVIVLIVGNLILVAKAKKKNKE